MGSKGIGFFVVCFAVMLISSFVMFSPFADAMQSAGTEAPGRMHTSSYGGANNLVICGGVLCSEYPGGYTKYKNDQRTSSTIAAEPIEITTQTPESTEESMETKILRPLQQVALGISPQDLTCKDDFLKLYKSNGNPICVSESTAEKLIARGFTK